MWGGALAVLVVTLIVALLAPDDPIPRAINYGLETPPRLDPATVKTILGQTKHFDGLWAPEGIVHIYNEERKQEWLYLSLGDGRIVRGVLSDSSLHEVTLIARTGWRSSACDNYTYDGELGCARPLGLAWDPKRGLLVCDAYRGLLLVSKAQCYDPVDRYQVDTLVDSYDGKRLMFANFPAIDQEKDIVYFSDSSEDYQRRDVLKCLYDGRPTGRVFSFNLQTRELSLLMSGLGFANGIVLQGAHLLVALSRDASIIRYALDGSGATSVFAANLPCVPDNIHLERSINKITLGCAFRRCQPFSFVDYLSSRKWLRSWILRLVNPLTLSKWLPKYGMVLFLDPTSGEVKKVLEDPDGRMVDVVSEAIIVSSTLIMGSWRNPWLGLLPLNSTLLKWLAE